MTEQLSVAGTATVTAREAAKARRRQDLLDASAALFAERGFDGVRLEDIGAACGISGPGIYRHFSSKAAVLTQLFQTVSTGLLMGGRAAVVDASPGRGALTELVAFHVDFALRNRDVIRVQDRDLPSVPEEDRVEIARVQRAYIDLWAEHIQALHPDDDPASAVFRAQAVFGLINSTPRSVRRSPADRRARRPALIAMAWGALEAR
ncbi:MAG: TetR/AcrR family transcriptional regulator [Micrococcus sp.]|nr:TetR/AcrR family transcriptional regulator [Micrococcus sp.]